MNVGHCNLERLVDLKRGPSSLVLRYEECGGCPRRQPPHGHAHPSPGRMAPSIGGPRLILQPTAVAVTVTGSLMISPSNRRRAEERDTGRRRSTERDSDKETLDKTVTHLCLHLASCCTATRYKLVNRSRSRCGETHTRPHNSGEDVEQRARRRRSDDLGRRAGARRVVRARGLRPKLLPYAAAPRRPRCPCGACGPAPARR